MPVRPEDFRRTLGHFASGITVVTVAHGQQYGGLTVSAFCSVSLTPPYILVCIDKRSSAIALLQQSRAFVVNILSADQVAVSNQFASKAEDKFAGIDYHIGHLGIPVVDGALGSLECTVAKEVDAGDHLIYIGQVEHALADDTKQPLAYYHGGYRVLAEQ